MIDFPLRSVIRGHWEIGDHRVNEPVPPAALAGPAIGGLRRPGGTGFDHPLRAVVDSGVAPADREALDRVRGAAARAVRRRVLSGLPGIRPAMTRVSQIFRVNRVEGLRLGAGLAWHGGPIDRGAARIGYGTSDRRVTGALELARELGRATMTVSLERAVTDLGDWPVVSQVVNSLMAQEGGRDLGDYVLREWAGVDVRWPAGALGENRVALGRVGLRSVPTRARPARGTYRSNPVLGGPSRWVASVAATRGRSVAAGLSWRTEVRGELGAGADTYGRLAADLELARPLAGGEFAFHGRVGLGTVNLPPDRAFVIGGQGTLPGEVFRGFGGRWAGFGVVDWLVAVPGPSIGLGALGRTSAVMRVGPMLGVGWAGGAVQGQPWDPNRGGRPMVGLVVEAFDRTIRLEIGQRLRGAGGPTIAVDLARAWWPVL